MPLMPKTVREAWQLSLSMWLRVLVKLSQLRAKSTAGSSSQYRCSMFWACLYFYKERREMVLHESLCDKFGFLEGPPDKIKRCRAFSRRRASARKKSMTEGQCSDLIRVQVKHGPILSILILFSLE